jgi:hypothetical protein
MTKKNKENIKKKNKRAKKRRTGTSTTDRSNIHSLLHSPGIVSLKLKETSANSLSPVRAGACKPTIKLILNEQTSGTLNHMVKPMGQKKLKGILKMSSNQNAIASNTTASATEDNRVLGFDSRPKPCEENCELKQTCSKQSRNRRKKHLLNLKRRMSKARQHIRKIQMELEFESSPSLKKKLANKHRVSSS